jgi:hypothetical protein
MHNRSRNFVAAFSVMAASASIAAGNEVAPADPQLLGCWRAERVEQTLADGTKWTDIGGCTLKFEADRITSACALRAGNQPIKYSYSLVTPGTYRARITEHPMQPQAQGNERDYSYRIEGDNLYITTFPQTALPVPTSRAVKVESVSVKVGSPTDLADRRERKKAGCEGELVRRGGDGGGGGAAIGEAIPSAKLHVGGKTR